MEKIIKIAKIKAANIKNLNEISDALKDKGFIIVYGKSDNHAYVCIKLDV